MINKNNISEKIVLEAALAHKRPVVLAVDAL